MSRCGSVAHYFKLWTLKEKKKKQKQALLIRVQFCDFLALFCPIIFSFFEPFFSFLSLVLRDLCICLYRCVYTDVNVCVPLPLWYAFRGSGGKTECMYLSGCNAKWRWLLLFFLNSECKNWSSFQRSHSLQRMHFLYLYISFGCITGSMSHQPLYHCCSKYQVKAFAVSFSKNLCTVDKYI